MGAIASSMPESHIVGRINHVRTERDSTGRPLWFVDVDTEKESRETLAVTDEVLARRLGIDSLHSSWAPNFRGIVEFDVTPGSDILFATGAQGVYVRRDMETPADATNPGLLMALSRNEARMALSAAVGVCRASPGVSSANMSKVENDFEEWRQTRGRHCPERERLAIIKALRSARKAAADAATSLGFTDDAAFPLLNARNLCDRAGKLMRQARIEAADGLDEIARSKAVGQLLSEFPHAANQSAAMTAWAAYFTIRDENPGGIHDGKLSAIRTCLARAYEPGMDARAEIAAALDSAWCSMVYVERDMRRDPIRSRSIRAGLANIETAMSWIDMERPAESVPEDLHGLGRSLEREAILRRVLQFQGMRGCNVIEVERDDRGGAVGRFHGGDTLHVSRDGVVRVKDMDGKVLIVATPGRGIRHFHKGRPTDEQQVTEAVEVAHEAALQAASRGCPRL